MDLPSVAKRPLLLNRERALLEFNRRVLAQARRADVPLLERLRYICIVSSNMDEFFEVRLADYVEPLRQDGGGGFSAEFEAIACEAHALIDDQYAAFSGEVMPALRAAGIAILSHGERDEAQRRWVRQFYREQVQPLLMPVGLDPAHPFPQVANKSLHFIARLGGTDAFGRENSISIVKVPRVLPRVIRLPHKVAGGRQAFVLLSSVIRSHLEELYEGRTVEAFSQFRLTRDSELAVDEAEVKNLRHALRSGLTARHYGQSIRLEVSRSCPEPLVKLLLDQFKLPPAALYLVPGPVNLLRLNALVDAAEAPELHFEPYTPAWPAGLPRRSAEAAPPGGASSAVPDSGGSIFRRLRDGDVLLHHPFESFEPVVQFLREAVHDPDVLSIKQTIYRTGSESPLMDLLMEAVRRGKEVTCVVELKARFDEEANINWAERLEAIGAQVLYGVVGLKTHAKLLVVTRREGRPGRTRLRRYAHLSTGNYNPRTARLYTDVGMLTADAELTADADAVFQQLASLGRMTPLKRLQQAPFTLHGYLIGCVGKVAAAAAAGKPARIVLKMNALTDAALIEALIAAGRAGARIDLVIRGACLLPPGLPGYTDRIAVRSIIGRYLEHSRIFYFRWGKSDGDEQLWLSSADWMSRNMFRRIEVAWPVRDAALRQRVIDECLVPYLLDTEEAWLQAGGGSFRRVDVPEGAPAVSAQKALMRLHGPRRPLLS